MVKIIYRDKEWEVKPGITVKKAIKEAGLLVEAVLPIKDGKLITEDTVLKDGDVVRLIAVISGG
ncbi:MAG: thiamine biosynthesis protein ThiS [Chloroflexi bacterium]|nr:MAG: thiamine biosynthesis protein ThiS [Chloroflexota bacterium]